jgi:hypothetical protein
MLVWLLGLTSLAAGQTVTADFNHDGFAGLAIGASGESVGNIVGAGAVHIIYGRARGLTAPGNQLFHQNSEGLLETARAGDSFGTALAAGDFNHDGFADLAIGVPGKTLRASGGGGVILLALHAGVVHILYGSPSGLTAAGNQLFPEKSPGIGGGVDMAYRRFGAALAVGDFNNDHFADLAIGIPDQDFECILQAGAVQILYGRALGLSATGKQLLRQGVELRGSSEESDHFGAALAAGDFNNDGFTDLAIGVPDEDIEDLADAGVVHIVYGSASGMSLTGNQRFHRNKSGLHGPAEANDRFGGAFP